MKESKNDCEYIVKIKVCNHPIIRKDGPWYDLCQYCLKLIVIISQISIDLNINSQWKSII